MSKPSLRESKKGKTVQVVVKKPPMKLVNLKPKTPPAQSPLLLIEDRFGRSAIFDPNAKPPNTGYSFAYGNDVVPEDIPIQVGDPANGINGGSELMLMSCLAHSLKGIKDNHFTKIAGIHLSLATLIMAQEDIYQKVIQKFPDIGNSEKEAIQCYLLTALLDEIPDDQYVNAIGDVLENQDAYMYLDSAILDEIKQHMDRA